ncbi:unnamed protein product [Medioppia subpectinata]|uniref:Uncharacterized protein n=1 Tax=Medioppia subpectinata TaxID=1979941 RepID=A0A7R9KHF5_9ACAR|nr:unnamed protein product [Medioppia subpectinata]CAG2103499.1 unnamed protein product [Medioppia subpectinata]
MGCFFSIFRFGTYVVKESDNNGGPQVNAPEIRKHSSTPIGSEVPLKAVQKPVKPLHSSPPSAPPKKDKQNVPKVKDKEKPAVFTTTFETQVDAPPPHPLEERFQDIQLDEIEVETNLFAPEVEDAVIKIQAGVRGYLVRKQLKSTHEDDEDTPVVPPPKHFEDNQTLSPLKDLEKWKKLSDHLEEKVAIDGEDTVNKPEVIAAEDQSSHVQKIADKLVENVIPLKDSNDHKVIETYVCKDNILDVEPVIDGNVSSDRDVLLSSGSLSPIRTAAEDAKVVDRVFSVLMAETEFPEDVETVAAEIAPQEVVTESKPKTTEEINNEKNLLNEPIVSESQESEVLAELNQILDNNEKNMKNNELNAEEEEAVLRSAELIQQNEAKENKAKVIEMVSENTTQEIIRNSFKEFVKEMTQSAPTTDTIATEEEVVLSPKVTESAIISAVIEPPVEETRKTDSKLFEDEVVRSIFGDEEVIKTQNQTQVFAIELFKQDVNEQQLEKVVTISAPEESKANIEDRVYKTSVEEFVIKAPVVEPNPPLSTPIPTEVVDTSPAESSQTIPLLETERIIEIITSESRKNSVDDILDDSDGQLLSTEDQLRPVAETTEVIPLSSPIIQIEEQNGRILDEEEAAIRIQAAFRGFQIRRSLSREASPNRSTNHNNNIDNNNNSHNNRDLGHNNNSNHNNSDITEDLTTNQLSDNLLIAENTSEPQRTTTTAGLMTASNEQINTSLEQLEDQLMQQLISTAEEEDRHRPPVNVETPEDQLFATEELSAPLLLQRIQQSVDTPVRLSEESVELPPELASFVTQTIAKEISLAEDKPLIEKSDTIIVDLLSSSPQQKSIAIETQAINDINNSESETQEILPPLEIIPNAIDIREPEVQTTVCPPTPSQITPEVSFARTAEQPVLTKIYSSESEQESDAIVATKATDNSLPSLIPVIEANGNGSAKTSKAGAGDAPKRPNRSILKETEPQLFTDEQHMASEEISSPDDDNPEFVGLGPNNPFPIRASSPNPFGKKRRRGKKGGQRK